MPLVNGVLLFLERIHAHCQVQRRRDSADGAEVLWRIGSEIACKLQREISAEGITGNREGRESVHIDELAHYGNRIAGESRVIKAVRQVLGRTAVPLVESNRVEAGGECLVGEAAHVVRIAGAFEAVKRDQRG